MAAAGMTSATDISSVSDLQALRAKLQHLRQTLGVEASASACVHDASGEEVQQPLPPVDARKQPVISASEQKEPVEQPLLPDKTKAQDAQEVRLKIDHLLRLASKPQSLLSSQDRQLALDLLGVLLPLVGEGAGHGVCARLIERLLVMEAPPRALLTVVLEHASAQDRQRLAEEAQLPEDLLQDLVHSGDDAVLQGIVQRRQLPACVSAVLVEHVPAEMLRGMLRNKGVVIADVTWWRLLERALQEESLLVPLAMRADLPRHVALELFWHVDAELRRHIMSRFASDSQQLGALLEQVDMHRLMSDAEFLVHLHVVLGVLTEGDWPRAARMLAEKTELGEQLCHRILHDRGGEPLAVLVKAHGIASRDFMALLQVMQKHRLAGFWQYVAQPARLETLYGTVSINRARMVLLYWAWHCDGVGPYRDFRMDCA